MRNLLAQLLLTGAAHAGEPALDPTALTRLCIRIAARAMG